MVEGAARVLAGGEEGEAGVVKPLLELVGIVARSDVDRSVATAVFETLVLVRAGVSES